MRMIADAPYIREAEATGYCSSGWWNETPAEEDPWAIEWECPDDLAGGEDDEERYD